MLSSDFKNYSIGVFFIALTILAAIVTHNYRILAHNVNGTTQDIAEYVRAEKGRLEDPKNSKALDAMIQTGAVLNASGRLLNTQVIPRGMKDLDQLHELLAGLTGNSKDLSTVLLNTDGSVNKLLMPRLATAIEATTNLVNKSGMTADEATQAIAAAAKMIGTTEEQVEKMLADPRWSEAADNLVKTSAEGNKLVADVHTDLHDTMKQMPHTMAQVDKTATNIARLSKISIWASIIATLAHGFIPGY